jgi:hypothetical protein
MVKTELLGSIRFNVEFDAELLPKLDNWIVNRGGILAWENCEIGGSGSKEVYTPALTEEGTEYPSPGWRYAGKPLIVDISSAKVIHSEIVEQYRGRIKQFYWGVGLFGNRHNRLVEQYKARDPKCEYDYRFEFDGYGLATVYIERLVANKLYNSLSPAAQAIADDQDRTFSIPTSEEMSGAQSMLAKEYGKHLDQQIRAERNSPE